MLNKSRFCEILRTYAQILCLFCLNDQAYNCLIHFYKRGLDIRQTSGKAQRKTTFYGRQPFTEDDLWQKTTFDGRQLLTENNFRRKMTFDGRRPLMEDEIWRNTTYMEEDLWREKTFDGRRPSKGCKVYHLKKIIKTPHLDSHCPTDPKPEIISAV